MEALKTKIDELQTLVDKFTPDFWFLTSEYVVSRKNHLERRLMETVPSILESLQTEMGNVSQRVRCASPFMIMVDLFVKFSWIHSSDGRINIIETLIGNPDADQPTKILRSYLTYQNDEIQVPPLEIASLPSTSAIPQFRVDSDQRNDESIYLTIDDSNMVAGADYNIVLQFEPSDKRMERFKSVLTPKHRPRTQPATTVPSETSVASERQDVVDSDISRDNENKKRRMDSDAAKSDINPHQQLLGIDMSKFSPPISYERVKAEVRQNPKRRVESETLGQVQGPSQSQRHSQSQLPLRRSARLQKNGVGNDEEAKYSKARVASKRKGKGKK